MGGGELDLCGYFVAYLVLSVTKNCDPLVEAPARVGGVVAGSPGPARSRRNPSIPHWSSGGGLARAIDRRGPDSFCSFLLALLRTRELSDAVAVKDDN